MRILEVKNIKKRYLSRFGLIETDALKGISFNVEQGEFIAIMGESGSGKTTLLNILAGLDSPTSGGVFFQKEDLLQMDSEQLVKFRRENLGFVFQDFNLLHTMTVKDNILLPLVLSKTNYQLMENLIMPIVEQLAIETLLTKYPYELSGGQKQRVAIARAQIIAPQLLLADEPTGALDSQAATKLMHTFSQVNQQNQTILMVTHSVKAASFASRIFFIRDGVLFHQLHRGDKSNKDMLLEITDALAVVMKNGATE
ncbi:MAG: ABC transporter ATP-binding protein [Culicoidibacterales bacterium]